MANQIKIKRGAQASLPVGASGEPLWTTDTNKLFVGTGSGNIELQAALTFGIADTNKVQINSADVADNDYAKFTATGLEGRSYAEVLSDIGAQASLGFTPEDVSNKSTNVVTDGASDTKYPSVKAIKDYADGLVAGLLDYRGAFDASVNTFPATGGSGTAGAILKGDMWVISVAGTLGGSAVQAGDSLIANTDTPGQTAGNWNTLNTNITYVPEDVANKVTSISGASTDVQYASAKLLFDQLALKAPLTSPTFATSIGTSYLTASEILGADASKNIVSLPVATYPSLAELAHVKGVTSAIQTQIGNKAPSANPTFTGTVTLPKTLEIHDTSSDHQYVLAVSELTADRTITLPLLTGTDTFVFQAHTQTLTNKRVTKRVTTTTNDATAVIDIDTCDEYELSAVADPTEFTTTGTPTDGQTLIVRLKDAGVAKALTWTGFTAIGVTLPTTTVAGKWTYVGFKYNSAATAWHGIAVTTQA